MQRPALVVPDSAADRNNTMSHPEASSSEGGRFSPLSTSKSLLGRAREGDATAWDRLSLLYAPLVFHWCRHRGLREADAADIVQEVFQAVAAHLGPFRKQEASDTFRGWLRTITENKIRDHFRRMAHETEAIGGTDAQHRLAHRSLPRPASRATTPTTRLGSDRSSVVCSTSSARNSRNGPGWPSGGRPSPAAHRRRWETSWE